MLIDSLLNVELLTVTMRNISLLATSVGRFTYFNEFSVYSADWRIPQHSTALQSIDDHDQRILMNVIHG